MERSKTLYRVGTDYKRCVVNSMSEMLDRLTTLAAIRPCSAPRVDLLQLLTLAGLAETHLFSLIEDRNADPVTVDGAALRAMVWMARRAGQPASRT